MNDDDFRTSDTAAFFRGRSNEYELLVSFVTDEVVQVVVTFSTLPNHVDGGAWLLADAVDITAAVIEEKTGNPFRSFVTVFSAAWAMRSARKDRDRKGTPP